MTTPQFSPDEWKLLINAPRWVYTAITAGERGNIFARGTEEKALEQFLAGFPTRSPLVKEIIARQKEADDKLTGSSAGAERALGQVNSLLERKASLDEADAVRDLLMNAGQAVAQSSHEKVFGKETVSDAEKATLARVETALKAGEADKRARRDAAVRDEAAKVAQQQREAEARAAAERQKQEAAREEAQRQAAEAEAKRKAAEADAKKRAEEAEARRQAAEAVIKRRAEEAEAKRLAAEAEAQRAAAEAEAQKAAAEAEAQKAAAEAAKSAESVAVPAQATNVYVVKKGDTLSGIAQQVYGKAGRWREIYEANQDIIKNPNLIRPGWKLRIP